MELLLGCVPGQGGQPARMQQILRRPMDWQFLFRRADENGMLSLLCERLRDRSDVVPVATKAPFGDASRKNMYRGLLLCGELLRITEALGRSGIAALCYKGPVLGQVAYGDPLLRQFADLDMVVSQKSMAAVYSQMEALGYTAKFPRRRFDRAERDIPGEYVFVREASGAMVEFHTERTLRHFPRPPDLDAMIGRSVTVPLNRRPVATFAPADTMLLLCVHGAKDFWSRLIWVADVAALAGKLSDADWQGLFAGASRYDAGRMVTVGLWLAHAVFECRLPAAVLEEVQEDRVAVGLARQLRDHLLRATPLPAGVAWRSLYRIRMVPPLWKGTRYWVRLSTAPAEEDWSGNQHVAGARARYRFLRPLRLWRKYGASAREQWGDKRG